MHTRPGQHTCASDLWKSHAYAATPISPGQSAAQCKWGMEAADAQCLKGASSDEGLPGYSRGLLKTSNGKPGAAVQFKGMPMTPQMSPMGFAPPGLSPPHGFMPLMPQQALPFTIPPSGAPPSSLRGGAPGDCQVFVLDHACCCACGRQLSAQG